MPTRVLESSPRMLPLYARAAAPLLPGASHLPFVPGGGREIPDIELELSGVRPDRAALASYARVCGFALREELPATYPQVLAFPLHMALMAEGSFPFGAVGLVHVENRILQRRPLEAEEELTIRVRPTALQPHPKGRTFTIETEVRTAGEMPWEGVSTFLHRGESNVDAVSAGMRPEARPGEGEELDPLPDGAPAAAVWRLGGDLGRRYAAVSGDRNPIHLHPLTAKPLGFPAAIAHGMWTKARCLAALEGRLPAALEVEVRFRKPIRLPGAVGFASSVEGERIRFSVRDAERGTPHLDGRVRALDPQATSERSTRR
jgi:acyl dehydratase